MDNSWTESGQAVAASQRLAVYCFTLGDWMTNCYVLARPGGACWLVDVGFEPSPMLEHVEREGLAPQAIVLTHAHVDHIGGLAEARRAYPELPIYLHEDEQAFPGDAALNLSIALSEPVVAPEPTHTLQHGQHLELDGLTFEVRHTPGHSPGGITIHQPEENIAVVGDALFAGAIGRYDFPTSDGPRLLQSIRQQLLTMPDETRILPGHGPATTIGQERRTNPFFQ